MNQELEITTPEVAKTIEKIALLELNPRGIRLVLALYTQGESFEVYNEFNEPVNIYEDIARDGFIKPTQIAHALKTVKMYRKLCDSLQISKAIAYATSALRDAKNHYGFLEELEIASGFKIKLLQQHDETTASYTGVVNSLDAPKGVLLNIQDEYIQLTHYCRKIILNQTTIPFGAETLATLFMENVHSPIDQMQLMTDFIVNQLKKEVTWFGDLTDEELKFMGMGEVILSIGRISRKGRKYPIDQDHYYILDDIQFNNVYKAIAGLDMEKSGKIRGIGNKTASVIACGLSVLKAVRQFVPINNIIISATDISTGVLFNQCVTSTNEKPIVDVLMYSLISNEKYHPTTAKNCLHIYELSTILFRQLRVMHKLGRLYLKPLKVASMMYNCGERIRFHPNKKDALQIILNSKILGLSHHDQVLAAFIASSQYSEDFSVSEWVKYKDLVTDEDLQAVRKLAVILRIAVNLDVAQESHITDVMCDVLGDSVIMKTVSNCSDVLLELKCASQAGPDFKKVYNKNLELL